jgi:hypothetical protein
LIKWPWLFLLSASLAAADAPKLFYSKAFPGSTPAYIAITVEKTGAGEYKEAPDDQIPIKFQLSASDTDQMFSLAGRLQYFKRPLESGLKVANMGLKTFRYENGAEKSEVQFNYSDNPDARLLTDWFERISETAQHLTNLERAVKYDKLGVNKALLQFEASIERKRLVALDLFLPMLDRISKNETYLHMARTRAAGLAEMIRANK